LERWSSATGERIRDEGMRQPDSRMRRTTVAAALERHRKTAEVGPRDHFVNLLVEFAQRPDLVCQHREKLPPHLLE
jgi:hypothetical protein